LWGFGFSLRRAQSAERRAQSAERKAQSAKRKAQSAKRKAKAGACSRACGRALAWAGLRGTPQVRPCRLVLRHPWRKIGPAVPPMPAPAWMVGGLGMRAASDHVPGAVIAWRWVAG
jgi:hypothetical protein